MKTVEAVPRVEAANIEKRLQALYAARTKNREDYHAAANAADAARMRTLRQELQQITGEIKDLEGSLEVQREILSDLARAQVTLAQMLACENAVRAIRADLNRSDKALARTLKHLHAACVAYREHYFARDSARGYLRVVPDRRLKDDLDIAFDYPTYSLASLLSRVSNPTAGTDVFGFEFVSTPLEQWAERAERVETRIAIEIHNNHERAASVAERMLPPQPPEAA